MRLIDADMLCNYCDNNINHSITPNEIMRMPFIDAEPVKHGRWIIIDDTEKFLAKCSVCGRVEDTRCIADFPYCHCGAKMDLRDGESE